MNILFIDTSTSIASLAISKGEQIFIHESSTPNSHIEEIDSLVEQLLSVADMTIEQVTAIVIGSGPGSFTGLRIGYSYVFGIASALKIPVVKGNSFLSYCNHYKDNADVFICIADARRSEIFIEVFEFKDEFIISVSECSIVKLSELANLYASFQQAGRKVIVIGNVTESIPEGLLLTQPQKISLGLAELTEIESLPEYSEANLADLTPDYLRAVSALKISER